MIDLTIMFLCWQTVQWQLFVLIAIAYNSLRV